MLYLNSYYAINTENQHISNIKQMHGSGKKELSQ